MSVYASNYDSLSSQLAARRAAADSLVMAYAQMARRDMDTDYAARVTAANELTRRDELASDQARRDYQWEAERKTRAKEHAEQVQMTRDYYAMLKEQNADKSLRPDFNNYLALAGRGVFSPQQLSKMQRIEQSDKEGKRTVGGYFDDIQMDQLLAAADDFYTTGAKRRKAHNAMFGALDLEPTIAELEAEKIPKKSIWGTPTFDFSPYEKIDWGRLGMNPFTVNTKDYTATRDDLVKRLEMGKKAIESAHALAAKNPQLFADSGGGSTWFEERFNRENPVKAPYLVEPGARAARAAAPAPVIVGSTDTPRFPGDWPRPTRTFKTHAEAEAAEAAGQLKPGDKVIVGGRSATIR